MNQGFITIRVINFDEVVMDFDEVVMNINGNSDELMMN